MANMSYCRFENTSENLADCVWALREKGLRSLYSEYEKRGAESIYKLCKMYIELYEDNLENPNAYGEDEDEDEDDDED